MAQKLSRLTYRHQDHLVFLRIQVQGKGYGTETQPPYIPPSGPFEVALIRRDPAKHYITCRPPQFQGAGLSHVHM
jgi:hypothetical protein